MNLLKQVFLLTGKEKTMNHDYRTFVKTLTTVSQSGIKVAEVATNRFERIFVILVGIITIPFYLVAMALGIFGCGVWSGFKDGWKKI